MAPPSLPDRLMKKLLPRIVDRQRRGERPPIRQLPVNKSEFPKLLCLDFNKWIDLARAHYNQPEGGPFRPALDALRQAIKGGKLIVPIASPNFAEASAVPNQGRRLRMAQFMVDLSENQSLLHEAIVMRWAMYAAVCRTHSVATSDPELRSSLLSHGLGAVLGIPSVSSAAEAVARDMLFEPEASVHYLVEGTDRETIKGWLAEDEEVARQIDAIRELDAHMTMEQRRHLELTNLLTEESLGMFLVGAVRRAGLRETAFFEWLKTGDHVMRFAEQVPPIDVHCTLMLHRDRNPQQKTKRNDGRDLSFFDVALPYANVIVTEKLWGHVATSSGLAKKYGTTVLTNLQKLPDVLRDEGCL